MEAIISETVAAQRLPWSRPQVRRLAVSLNTQSKTGSYEDCIGTSPVPVLKGTCD